MAILVAIGIAILIILIGPLNVLVGAGVIIIVGILIVRWSDNRRPGIGGEGYAVRYAGQLHEDTWYRQLVEASCIANQRRVNRGGYNEFHFKIPSDWSKYGDHDLQEAHDWLEKNGEQWGVYIDYE